MVSVEVRFLTTRSFVYQVVSTPYGAIFIAPYIEVGAYFYEAIKMAHELSITESGIVEMAYAGEVPWHGLGTKVEGLMTSAEALEAAHLDWSVELIEARHEVITENGGRKYLVVPDTFVTRRTDTNFPLGVVGKRYNILQNVDAFSFFDELVQEQAAMYETCGAIFDGRRTWILAKLPNHITIGEADRMETYVLLSNSHDGSTCVTIKPVIMRVVCWNTLQVAIGENATAYKIRHTASMLDKVAVAREALGVINTQFDEMQDSFRTLAEREMSGAELGEYFIDVASLTVSDEGELGTRGENIITQLMDNLDHETNNIGDMRNTAWAGYNAVTQWVDHQRILKKDGTLRTNGLQNALFGSGEKIKEKALTAALRLV